LVAGHHRPLPAREEAVGYSGGEARRDQTSGVRRRSLGPAQALLLLVAIALAGGCIDVVTGSGLRLGFAIGLFFGSLLAALLVHRHGLPLVVFAPPLVFLAASLLFVVASPGSAGGTGRLLDAATGWLVYGFPTMAAATGIAVVTAGIRVAQGSSRI
jgi:Domain of unknown function (DUF6542)